MNLTAVLVTGLLAGGVSCSAVQGGLLTGLVARQRKHGSSGSNGTAPGAIDGGWKARLADDLAPTGGFLAGKLASHSLFGALLGGLGTIVELSAEGRAWAQLAAGALIVCFGLAQLEVPGFRGLTITPPQSWLRMVRGRARSRAALAPAILGFATVLIPCGITLSVMALALTSGSWASGAATMAVFVIGTGPLFTAIGYVAQKAATAWQGRLAAAIGVVLLGMGLYAFNGGLTVLDSPLAAQNVMASLRGTPAVADASTVQTAANGSQTVTITVGAGGYTPGNVLVKAGVPTALVFRSTDTAGCKRGLVIPSLGIDEILPESGDTTVEVGTLKRGTIDYSCSMGMYSGRITIQ